MDDASKQLRREKAWWSANATKAAVVGAMLIILPLVSSNVPRWLIFAGFICLGLAVVIVIQRRRGKV